MTLERGEDRPIINRFRECPKTKKRPRKAAFDTDRRWAMVGATGIEPVTPPV